MDLLVTGNVIGVEEIEGKSEIYVNDGGVFTPPGVPLPAPISSAGRRGAFTWFDVDGDGDLDYLVAGAYFVPDGNGLVEARVRLCRNRPPAVNAPPGGLAATPRGGDVALSSDPVPDDHTPAGARTYDVEVCPSQGRPAGAPPRRLPEPGTVRAVTRWALRGLRPGTYTWGVRAVDSAFDGGPRALGTFTIAPGSPGGGGAGRDSRRPPPHDPVRSGPVTAAGG